MFLPSLFPVELIRHKLTIFQGNRGNDPVLKLTKGSSYLERLLEVVIMSRILCFPCHIMQHNLSIIAKAKFDMEMHKVDGIIESPIGHVGKKVLTIRSIAGINSSPA